MIRVRLGRIGATLLFAGSTACAGWLTSASTAHAQQYESSVGWNFGAYYGTSLNGGPEGAVQIEPELAVPSVAIHGDYWLGEGRVGMRLQFTGARPELEWQDREREIWTYTADASVMFRPLPTSPGRSFVPYGNLGVGAIWWRLGNGPPTVYPEAHAAYAGNEELDFIGVVGLGVDVVTGWGSDVQPLIIRLEGQDAVQFSSPLQRISQSGDDFDVIHNVRFGIGLHKAIGHLWN